MKKVVVWADRNREKFWFSVLLNLLFLTLIFIIFRPVYETNDDIGISNMVNGAKGSYDPHLVFVHYFLGLLLSAFYRLAGSVAWYALLQYAVLFCAFTAVTYVVIRRLGGSGVWIALILLTIFGYEGYVSMQFTKTAGIVSSAGMLVMFDSVDRERARYGELLCGIALACLGSMYRYNQFFAEAFLMTGTGVCFLLVLHRREQRVRFGMLVRCIASFAVLLGLVLGLHWIDQSVYQGDPSWKEYQAYNRARARLYDFGFPDYDAHRELYQELGINKNALKMYRDWNHMDTEKLTTEVLRELEANKEPRAFDRSFVEDFFETFPVGFFTIPVFYGFLLIFVFWLFWGNHRREEIAALVYEALITGLLYLYLFYEGRYLYNRVDVGLWFAVTLVLLWTFRQGAPYFQEKTGLVLFLAVTIFCQKDWSKLWRVNSEKAVSGMLEARAVIEEIGNDTEHLYLAKAKTISFAKSYGVFDQVPFGMARNLYPLGGWASASPVFADILAEYGVSNPFRDVVGNEAVYLIDSNMKQTMKYIHTYYDEDAEAVLVKEIGGYKVYQIFDSAAEASEYTEPVNEQ